MASAMVDETSRIVNDREPAMPAQQAVLVCFAFVKPPKIKI